MFVAASTSCFPDLSLQDAFDKLADLEYTNVEIVVREIDSVIRPSEIVRQFDEMVRVCRLSRRITPVAIFFDVEPEAPMFLEDFAACCRLAKACRTVVVTVHASIRGFPFNEEVERLKTLVRIATNEGITVGLLSEGNRLSEDPDAALSLCKNVHGLAVTLDPSHFIFGMDKVKDFDSVLEMVCHVRLRDTTKDTFQVQIGQGILEYGRLAIQLEKMRYNRALCVDLAVLPNIDPIAELRKMRLLLESLL